MFRVLNRILCDIMQKWVFTTLDLLHNEVTVDHKTSNNILCTIHKIS